MQICTVMLQKNLKSLRIRFGFNFSQLERNFDLGRGSYANLEKNDQKVSPAVLLSIVRFYGQFIEGLTLEALLTEDVTTRIEDEDTVTTELSADPPQQSQSGVGEAGSALLSNLDAKLIQLLNLRLQSKEFDLERILFKT